MASHYFHIKADLPHVLNVPHPLHVFSVLMYFYNIQLNKTPGKKLTATHMFDSCWFQQQQQRFVRSHLRKQQSCFCRDSEEDCDRRRLSVLKAEISPQAEQSAAYSEAGGEEAGSM